MNVHFVGLGMSEKQTPKMNSWYHAKSSAKKWGGRPEDYIDIHEFIDSSKKIVGDVRHRSMYHHTEGIWLCQKIFGRTITVGGISGILEVPFELTDEEVQELKDKFENTPAGIPTIIQKGEPRRLREVPVRLIAELHVEQDLGWIPSPKDYIDGMVLKPWMGGLVRREMSLDNLFPKKEEDNG